MLGRAVGAAHERNLGQQIMSRISAAPAASTAPSASPTPQPDGYTMGIGSVGTHAHNQTLYKKPPYDAAADFAPVALIAETPVDAGQRARTCRRSNLKDFVAYTKANQAKMQFGSPGAGASSHIACVVLNHAIGVKPHSCALSRRRRSRSRTCIAGRIDYQCDQIVSSKPQIVGGSVKGVANLSRERSPRAAGPSDRVRTGLRCAGLCLDSAVPARAHA